MGSTAKLSGDSLAVLFWKVKNKIDEVLEDFR